MNSLKWLVFLIVLLSLATDARAGLVGRGGGHTINDGGGDDLLVPGSLQNTSTDGTIYYLTAVTVTASNVPADQNVSVNSLNMPTLGYYVNNAVTNHGATQPAALVLNPGDAISQVYQAPSDILFEATISPGDYTFDATVEIDGYTSSDSTVRALTTIDYTISTSASPEQVIPFPPSIFNLSPASQQAMTSFTLTVTGFNYGVNSVVEWNGTPLTTTFVSDTQLTAAVPNGPPNSPLASYPGTAEITVVNSDGGTEAPVLITLTAPPTITSFAPTRGTAGQGILIAGSYFTGATSVKFNGTEAASFTVNSDTQIAAYAPLGGTTGTLSVTTPSGTVTSAGAYTYLPPPTLSGFSPSYGPIGTVVTFTGTGFSVKPEIKFNGVHASATYVSDTRMTAPVPAGATTGKITLLRGPVVLVTSTTNFTVTVPPVISSFTPASGPVGTVVTINGSNLNGVSSIRFYGANAVTFSANGAGTMIAVTVPAGAVTGPIKVTTPGGAVQSSGSFTVTTPPVISSFSPSQGTAGQNVVITGSTFTGATSVKFHGTRRRRLLSSPTPKSTRTRLWGARRERCR